MNLYVLKEFADDVWDISGDFGKFDAKLIFDNRKLYAENGCIEVISQTEKFVDGVCVRSGKVKNISEC